MALSLMTVLLIAIDSDIRFNANHWSEQRRERYVASFWHWMLTFLTGIAPILNGVVLSIKNRFNFFAKHAAFVEASVDMGIGVGSDCRPAFVPDFVRKTPSIGMAAASVLRLLGRLARRI